MMITSKFYSNKKVPTLGIEISRSDAGNTLQDKGQILHLDMDQK